MSMSQRDTWNMYFAHILQGLLSDPQNSRNKSISDHYEYELNTLREAKDRGSYELVNDALMLMQAVMETVYEQDFDDEEEPDDGEKA